MLSIVQLQDVPGEPKIKLDLPGPLRIGDPVRLPAFRLSRQTAEGRTEQLEVGASYRFRVTAVGQDASTAPPRQLLTVETATGPAPVWKAVKKVPAARRKLSPARFPGTPV